VELSLSLPNFVVNVDLVDLFK